MRVSEKKKDIREIKAPEKNTALKKENHNGKKLLGLLAFLFPLLLLLNFRPVCAAEPEEEEDTREAVQLAASYSLSSGNGTGSITAPLNSGRERL